MSKDSRRWWRKKRFRLSLLLLGQPLVLLLGLVTLNGLVLADNETPITNQTAEQLSAAKNSIEKPQLKVLAYNIAKGFCHKGGIKFDDEAAVRQRMLDIASVIREQDPDLVFLSEAVFECGPCPVNQVELIAEEAGFDHWIFGENYNLGLPFYRIVGGNAILSRTPIEPVDNPSLAGRKPFYVTKNNRRVLWGRLKINGSDLLLGSIHNDSFDIKNNKRQMQQILDYIGERDALLAGDFNSKPHLPPIELVKKSEKFSGKFDGAMTFPAHAPDRLIDFIFAPARWQLVNHQVLDDETSDHRAVVSVFKVPAE